MKTKVHNFRKSEHALLRQWERCIPDKLIYLALRNYCGETLKNTLIWVSSPTINKWGFTYNEQNDLFIKVDGHIIVTLFFCLSSRVEAYLKKSNHYTNLHKL
jgi:hypothetical protein